MATICLGIAALPRNWGAHLTDLAIKLAFLLMLGISAAAIGQGEKDQSALSREYMHEVGKKVTPYFQLPPQLRGVGSAQIMVLIRGDGGINEITIKNSTGPQEIADDLRQGILKAQPLPPPPPSLLKDGIYQLTLTYAPPPNVPTTNQATGTPDPMDSLNDGFPKTYVSHDPAMGEDRIWRRIVLRGGPYGYPSDRQLSLGNLLIHPDDGAAVVYSAPGPAMKPGTELDQLEAAYIELSNSVPDLAKTTLGPAFTVGKVVPEGQPNTASAYFALLLKRGSEFTLLPLNYLPSNPKTLILKQRVVLLSSQYDATLDRYLIYKDVLFFTTPSWDSKISSWEHFDAWWLDAKKATIEHVVLPPGPWVVDANLDVIFLRAFRNFSCGVDCYRHYSIKVDNGNVFVTISGRPSAVSEGVVGTYKLKPGGVDWEKLQASP